MNSAAIVSSLLESEMPVVEKGIPIPLAVKTGDKRNVTKAVWPQFLLGLEPGDSFVVPYPTGTHIMSIGRVMGIKLVKQELPRSGPAIGTITPEEFACGTHEWIHGVPEGRLQMRIWRSP